MRIALPNIIPPPSLPTIRSGLGGAQEQGEPSTTPASASSLTLEPIFGGIFSTAERLEN